MLTESWMCSCAVGTCFNCFATGLISCWLSLKCYFAGCTCFNCSAAGLISCWLSLKCCSQRVRALIVLPLVWYHVDWVLNVVRRPYVLWLFCHWFDIMLTKSQMFFAVMLLVWYHADWVLDVLLCSSYVPEWFCCCLIELWPCLLVNTVSFHRSIAAGQRVGWECWVVHGMEIGFVKYMFDCYWHSTCSTPPVRA
jgi:hypothetical protein